MAADADTARLGEKSEFTAASGGAAIACGSASLFGPGPMLVAGLSLLLTAVSHEYGWSRTTFSTIPLLASWSAALTSPFYGRAMDRYGLRRVLVPCVAFFGLAFLPLALFAHERWHFFAAYLVIGAAAGSQGPVGYNKLIAQWFFARRGLVMALVAAFGSGLGYALAPQLINKLIEHTGWRSAYVALSLLILLISLPISFWLLRERTTVEGRTAQRALVDGMTPAEGLRSPAFWQLAVSLFFAANAFYGVLVHMFPMLLDRGVGRDTATNVVSMIALGGITGQIGAGVLLDRLNSPRVALLFFGAGLLGVLLIHHGTLQVILPGAALLGIGQGAELSVIGYLTSRLLGLRAFGALFGLIYAGAIAAAGLGPLMMGIVFDRVGSYSPMLLALEILLGIALLLVAFLPSYRYGSGTEERRSAAGTPSETALGKR